MAVAIELRGFRGAPEGNLPRFSPPRFLEFALAVCPCTPSPYASGRCPVFSVRKPADIRAQGKSMGGRLSQAPRLPEFLRLPISEDEPWPWSRWRAGLARTVHRFGGKEFKLF